MVRHNLVLFADVLRRRRPPEGSRLRELAASAVQRAEEGVPVEHVFSAYHVGMRVVWRRVTAGAGPEELPDLVEATVLLLDHLRVLTETVVGAYVHERLQMSGQEQAGRRSVLAALLEGRTPGAEAGGLRLAEAYVVLALAVSAHPDERGEDAGARIAARRKLRRLTGALQEWAPEHTLVALDTGGGTVLLPLDGAEAADAGGTARRVDALVARAALRAGADVRAAAAHCGRAEVPRARTEVAEVLRVVLAQGRPPGVYRLDDVLLEVQLSRPGPGPRQAGAPPGPAGGGAGAADDADGVPGARSEPQARRGGAARPPEHGGLPAAARRGVDRRGRAQRHGRRPAHGGPHRAQHTVRSPHGAARPLTRPWAAAGAVRPQEGRGRTGRRREGRGPDRTEAGRGRGGAEVAAAGGRWGGGRGRGPARRRGPRPPV
ncbi:hypothetical protein LUX05_18475 [Streptomyces somaliensis]|nr:hypothetical protein [Streptomyces somaliensis]